MRVCVYLCVCVRALRQALTQHISTWVLGGPASPLLLPNPVWEMNKAS